MGPPLLIVSYIELTTQLAKSRLRNLVGDNSLDIARLCSTNCCYNYGYRIVVRIITSTSDNNASI